MPILNDCPQGVSCDHEGALLHGRARALMQPALFLLDLALFRIAPDALKAASTPSSWLLSNLPNLLLPDRILSGNEVLDFIARSVRNESPRPTVRFLHLFSTHPPSRMDRNCETVVGRSWTRETALEQDQCAVSKVAGLLAALRAQGLYDRTAILVVADHGAGIAQEDWLWGAYASPLLLAKPFGARGALANSDRVVGIMDVGATVCAWTGSCRMDAGIEVTSTTSSRPRYPFTAYIWRHEYWLSDIVPIEDSFEVRGPPRSIASWWRLTHIPTRATETLRFAESNDATPMDSGGRDSRHTRIGTGVGPSDEKPTCTSNSIPIAMHASSSTSARTAPTKVSAWRWK